MITGAAQRPSPKVCEVVGRRVAPGASTVGDFTYSVIESSSDRPPGDRRGERRIKTHLREGHVREGRGRLLVECRIRDLSRRGARLQLDRERPLPRTFILREAGSLRTFLANLMWQVGRDAGVRLKPLEDTKA